MERLNNFKLSDNYAPISYVEVQNSNFCLQIQKTKDYNVHFRFQWHREVESVETRKRVNWQQWRH